MQETMDSHFFKSIIIIAFAMKYSLCTVGGISYMDPLDFRPLPDIPGSDPCNPLYWYPRNIPEYCYAPKVPITRPKSEPLPMPIPVPVPQPVLLPQPLPMLPMVPPPMPVGVLRKSVPLQPNDPPPMPPGLIPQPVPMTSPVSIPVPQVPLPYGLPIAPSNPMVPVGPLPQIPPVYFPYPQMPMPYPPQFSPPYPPNAFPQQAGMVPGLPGIVSPDGGINILPFSDVYTDLLEKHKNKMMRKRLMKIMREGDYPRISHRRYSYKKNRHVE